MSQTLTGKVALVTGGSRGIGAAIARRLAADGASVVLTYAKSPEKAVEVQKAIEASGGKALAIQADSADAAAVQGAIAKTVETYGRLDVLVNNAGLGLSGPIDQFSLEDFDSLVAVNVRAVFVAIQAAVRHMSEGGRIITIGSCLATRVPFGGISAYSMTKAAVTCMTQALSRELGPRGITINIVQPGPIDTDMNPADGPTADDMRKLGALGRYGRPEEVASMVAYLAGPEAGYVTGTSILVDGGANA